MLSSFRLQGFARQCFRLRWVVLILAVVCGLYFGVLHPWLMNWGATRTEQQMALPGDQLLPEESYRFTRAITIHAPAFAVWKWIVQIGQDRAGFYSNTWLENLTGANIHNANSIHAEWQHRTIGDRVPLARRDLFGGRFAQIAQTRIVALEPERLIAYIPCRFVLQPIDGSTTRLLLREPVPSTFAARTTNAMIWDPMHFVMEQRMLRGIKERAEGQSLVPVEMMFVARAGWILAAVSLFMFFLIRRRWWPWVLLPIAIALPVFWSTGDWCAALAGFLAIGISVFGALAFGRQWWLPYMLVATAVALMLLLAPDAYTAFGITLGIICVAALAVLIFQAIRAGDHNHPGHQAGGRAWPGATHRALDGAEPADRNCGPAAGRERAGVPCQPFPFHAQWTARRTENRTG